jgi:hypothetical protein
MEESRITTLKRRFQKLFITMMAKESRAYAEGFLIGWIAYLAVHDFTVIQKLKNLEKKYSIGDDGRP